MGYLTREAILGADDLPCEDVAVPEWGGWVRVRTLTGALRDSFEATLAPTEKGAKADLHNLRARLVSLAVVDESNAPLFTLADATALGLKSGKALDRVFEVARRLAGLTEEDVKELEKNSPSAPSVDSGSA